MKILFFFFLYCVSITVHSQIRVGGTSSINCEIPSIGREVRYSDTIFIPHTSSIKILNVDKDKIVISEESITDTKNISAFDFGNLNTARFSNVYYDTVGHIIYEAITENKIKFHCYSFKYNNKGQLVYKEGYSSGEEGVKIAYEYDINGKLVKETRWRAGGTTTKNY